MASIKSKQNDKKGLVINTLVVRKLNRNVLDVGQWRLALKAADNDRRQKLYELYEDIMLDPVLSNAIGKRINAITNADLVFMKDEEVVEEMDDLIDSPIMEEILTEIMNSKFWGKTVLELDFVDGLQAYNIPRQHIRPEKGIITINPGDEIGIPYRGDDFFLEAGKDKDFGLLLKAAPYAIFKRGGISDWAQFCEVFGIPKTVGKYSAQDEESRKALEEALESAGSNSWLIAPKETDIEMKESSTRGDGNLFNNFRKACNEEMLIAILGQVMTTLDGSSRAQSQVHKEGEEDVNKSDRRFVRRILNTELLPRLEKRGFPVKGGWFSFPDAAETISKKDQIEIMDIFENKLGLIVDEDYKYDTFGFPKPADGITKKPEPTKPTVPDPNAPTVPDPTKKDKKKEDKQKQGEKLVDAQTSFFTKLREGILSFFVPAPTKGAQLNGDLLTSDNLSDLPVFDIEDLAKRISAGPVQFDRDLYTFTSDNLLRALKTGFEVKNFAMGIDYGFTPDALKTAMEINLFHFSAGKTLAEVQKLNQAFRESKGWYDFLKRAREISGKFNEEWLRTEFDTAVNTAESSATYHRLMGQTDIFPYWQYITMDDGKVRPEHQRLHGVILPWNDPRWKQIWPPNGWNCRCRVKPLLASEGRGLDLAAQRAIVDDFLKSDEWKRDKEQGFGINRALTGDVFTANQMYIQNFPAKSGALLDKLTGADWGLDSIPNLIAKAKDDFKAFTSTAADLIKQESRSGNITLKLYNDRSIIIPEKDLSRMIRGKADKVELWNAAKETLATPDEIWLNNSGSSGYDNISLIKYYSSNAVVVDYKVENGNLVLKLWEKLSPKAIPRKAKRKGLLIKR